MIKIYTDGSCLNNPGNGGWAAIINHDGNVVKISGSEKKTTNNKMELMAHIKALQKIDNDELVSLIASDIIGIVEKWTEDFNDWQLQDSIVANIRKEIIIKLFDVSKTHSAISKENKDYIPFAEQLMKYIIQHY